jgi:hypothetical protein
MDQDTEILRSCIRKTSRLGSFQELGQLYFSTWKWNPSRHFLKRVDDRSFDLSWLDLFKKGSWDSSPEDPTRLEIEQVVGPGDWWRMVVEIRDDAQQVLMVSVMPIHRR